MQSQKLFKWTVGLLAGLGAIAVLGYVGQKDSSEEKPDKPHHRGPFGPFGSKEKAEDPCDTFPKEPVCRKERENPDEPTLKDSCFFKGSPCEEGSGFQIPSYCSGDEDLWLLLAKEGYPLQKVEGFDTPEPPGTKGFDIKAFHALVGLIARQNELQVPSRMPLPHELDLGERAALTAGVQMYNQLVDETPQFLRERAERIQKECDALPSDGFKPIRCAPFEKWCQEDLPVLAETTIEDAGSNGSAGASFVASPEADAGTATVSPMQSAPCIAMRRTLWFNGIRVKPEKIPECVNPTEAAPLPSVTEVDAGAPTAYTPVPRTPIIFHRRMKKGGTPPTPPPPAETPY